LKEKVAEMFKQETSSAALSTFTCAVCSSETYNTNKHKLLLSEINLDLLKKPQNACNVPSPYRQVDNLNLPKDVLVDPEGATVL
jgi:hypothetical protein